MKVRVFSLTLTDAEISACIHLCDQEARRTGSDHYDKVREQLIAFYDDPRHRDTATENDPWFPTNHRLAVEGRVLGDPLPE
jgi:hypothetical protein